MARFASEVDIKRIIKYSSNYLLNKGDAEDICRSNYLIICDNNPRAFCYPVKYLDGILIRYFSYDCCEVYEMCKFFSENFKGKIYLPHILDKNILLFEELGFKNIYKISQLSRNTNNLSISNMGFTIIDYDFSYFSDIKHIDTTLFQTPWQTTLSDIESLSKKDNIIRLCIYENHCTGFCIFKINKSYGYCYIVKIAVDKKFQNKGIGTALMNDLFNKLISNDIPFIFTDTNSEESASFFKKNGFKIFSRSNLLVKD